MYLCSHSLVLRDVARGGPLGSGWMLRKGCWGIQMNSIFDFELKSLHAGLNFFLKRKDKGK